MVKKIHVIELKETEFVQVEGTEDFTEVVRNKKKYPVYLTNYALSRGYDIGILKTSIIQDMLSIKNDLDDSKAAEDNAEALLNNIDENKMHDVIYLAFIGANPKENITKEEFLQQYHDSYTEKVQLYFNIITAAVDADPNAFAKGLENSMAKPNKDEKK